MVRVHHYKRYENLLVQKVKNGVAWLLDKIAGFFIAVFHFLVRRYTIVVVPHSEKKIRNFRVSIITLFIIFLVVAGSLSGFIWFSTLSGFDRASSETDYISKDAQQNLDYLKNEVTELSRAARSFEAVLSGTLNTLGMDSHTSGFGSTWGRPSLFGITGSEDIKTEIENIRQLSSYLASAVDPVKEIGSVLNSQSAILSGIPSIWPIRGGIGHFTAGFGINPDPFTGSPHMHSGVDISTYRSGDPIVATADGTVTYTGYEPSGFGNYVVIRHPHGFFTRYAHMLSIRAETGQQVRQGETIGYIGSTGRSTGPHLHYEVHIGSDVVDPRRYLNLRPRLGR